jgi:glycerol-3-phosphate acyltransferase PlsY
MSEVAAVALGYLIGSVPFSYAIAKLRLGIDIRNVDIGNVGAGSVIRTVGVREGIAALVGDVGKGVASILLAEALGVGVFWTLGAGFAAVLGHIFPLYIGFRGGQGVATVIGVFGALAPKAMGLTLAVMGIVLLLNVRNGASRRLFLCAACAGPVLPLFILIVYHSWLLAGYALLVGGFIAFRNRSRLKHPRSITHRLLGETDGEKRT